ncbi:MAG: Fic family protein [Myxococcaceae bacterium]
MRSPLSQRRPVGYLEAFLLGYQPNTSSYLSPKLRKHLHALGRTRFGERPAGTYARQILNRLLVDLSWASSRLEGNTYSRLDTENLLRFGRNAEGKDSAEAQMILNHKAAIELLVERAEEIGFNAYTFLNLHALLSENLLADPLASGRLRNIEVGITGTTYHPLSIPQRVAEYFHQFLKKANAISDPLEQSFFTMVHIPYLQPFEDMNKRVSRLGANISLIQKNLTPLSFVDVPEKPYLEGTLAIYELNRIELLRDVFAWAYERSCQRYTVIQGSLPSPDPFRVRHREALGEVVSEIVRGGRLPSPDVVRALSATQVDPKEMPDFVAMTLLELDSLHEGNIARYRIRPSALRDWLKVRSEVSD